MPWSSSLAATGQRTINKYLAGFTVLTGHFIRFLGRLTDLLFVCKLENEATPSAVYLVRTKLEVTLSAGLHGPKVLESEMNWNEFESYSLKQRGVS